MIHRRRNSDETEDSSYVHHRRKILTLNWKRQPSSVSLLVQPGLDEFSSQIDGITQFLARMGMRVEFNKYSTADFIVLVGSDGFNLTVSSLFQDKDTPPILSLSPKQPGFISSLEFSRYEELIPQIIRGNAWILPRSRLNVEYHSLEGVRRFTALNDIVVSREHDSGSLAINCSSSGLAFSQLIGDGVIIATATGSTAYNKGAGGALVHPLLPVFLLTPIVALSLSASPIMLPQSADLIISLDDTDVRRQSQSAYLTIDGKGHFPFRTGERVVITLSTNYYNSVLETNSIAEWPVRLANLMGWNERRHQKPLAPVKT